MLLRVLEGFVSLSCIRDMLFEANLEENFFSVYSESDTSISDIYILGLRSSSPIFEHGKNYILGIFLFIFIKKVSLI